MEQYVGQHDLSGLGVGSLGDGGGLGVLGGLGGLGPMPEIGPVPEPKRNTSMQEDGTIRRDAWKQVSDAAEKRLDDAKKIVDDAAATGQITPENVVFLHPGNHHLVDDSWKKFQIHCGSKALFARKIKLNEEQRKSFKITRKAGYMVCIGQSVVVVKRELERRVADLLPSTIQMSSEPLILPAQPQLEHQVAPAEDAQQQQQQQQQQLLLQQQQQLQLQQLQLQQLRHQAHQAQLQAQQLQQQQLQQQQLQQQQLQQQQLQHQAPHMHLHLQPQQGLHPMHHLEHLQPLAAPMPTQLQAPPMHHDQHLQNLHLQHMQQQQQQLLQQQAQQQAQAQQQHVQQQYVQQQHVQQQQVQQQQVQHMSHIPQMPLSSQQFPDLSDIQDNQSLQLPLLGDLDTHHSSVSVSDTGKIKPVKSSVKTISKPEM